MPRRYPQDVKRQYVARALIVGPNQAADAMGIPHRTGAGWWHDPRYTAELDPVARAHLAAEINETMVEALLRLRQGLRDQHARLSDIARAYEVLRDSHALLTGGPTARTESMNMNVTLTPALPAAQRAQLAAYVDSLLAKLDAGEVDEVERFVTDVVATERSVTKLIEAGEAVDIPTAQALLEARHAAD